jgi:3-isopropylmalate dehydrogenase
MLLRHSLRLETEARALEAAVSAALVGGARPADLAAPGTPATSTRAAGDAVLAALRAA